MGSPGAGGAAPSALCLPQARGSRGQPQPQTLPVTVSKIQGTETLLEARLQTEDKEADQPPAGGAGPGARARFPGPATPRTCAGRACGTARATVPPRQEDTPEKMKEIRTCRGRLFLSSVFPKRLQGFPSGCTRCPHKTHPFILPSHGPLAGMNPH